VEIENVNAERGLVHGMSQPLCGAATSMSRRIDEENFGSLDAPNRAALE
jgi:hypothetical protein